MAHDQNRRACDNAAHQTAQLEESQSGRERPLDVKMREYAAIDRLKGARSEKVCTTISAYVVGRAEVICDAKNSCRNNSAVKSHKKGDRADADHHKRKGHGAGIVQLVAM